MDISLLNPNNIFSFIISPSFSGTWFVLKILFIAVSFYFLISIFYFLSKTHYLQWRYGESLVDSLTGRPYGVKKIDKTWDSITKRLKSDLESDYKLAIIEADSILDNILKKMGYRGDDLEARLKQLSPVHYSNLAKMQEVHRIKNDIVRAPDYHLNIGEARKILATYREILEDLEVF